MAQWWDEWEMRVLLFASFSAQCCLALFAAARKFHIPPWLRFWFRLVSVGSDALALFALATLFNRQKSGPGCIYVPYSGSRHWELLWAPFLLMHLGGQVVITTYKIEDNEHSNRYILTSLSKVTVALYVFYKTWSSNDKKLLAATVLLFMVVIIRCFQKALALNRTSFNSLREANSSEINVVDQLEELLHFIQQAKEVMDPTLTPTTQFFPRLPCQLFLDFPCSYFDRLIMLTDFWWLDGESAYRAIEGALTHMTSVLYTKNDIREFHLKIHFKNASGPILFRQCTQALHGVTLLAVTLLVLGKFFQERKVDKDIIVTAILFICTILLELVYLFVEVLFRDKFSGRILQHNVIGLFANNRRHSKLRSIAGWLQCKDLLDSFWRVQPSCSCKQITELVRLHVETGWKEYIRDSHTYRMFNDTKGEWTLARNGCLQQLGWSTRRPFDESIVLWHLATDLYIHHTDHASPYDYECARRCKEMSNYMVHLLYDNPEMLMPGSRKRLLATVCEELEVLLGDDPTPREEKELTRKLFEKCELASFLSQNTSASLIGDAWKLAQSLLSFDENDTRIWDLIIGVWVEMLCFSASRCRGYLHAEALGTGVEYLSYAWILLAYTGMETFPEKLQRRECHSFDSDAYLGFGLARERGDAVTPLASQSEGTVDVVLEA